MKIKIFLMLFLTALLLNGGEIRIAAAANVSYAIDDLIKEFNTLYPKTKVTVLLGSSGKLTAQIKNGAPYHIFMSANMKYPKALYDEKSAVTKPKVYAKGSLAYLSAKKLDFSKGILLTKESDIKKIAIANPKTAPYGKATVEAMKNAGVYEEIKNKLIYAESISQSVVYAITAADMGFVAKSALYSSKMKRFKEGINYKSVDPKLYTPISQGVVILKKGEKNPEVKAFYDFIFSPKAKKIFKKYGYLIP